MASSNQPWKTSGQPPEFRETIEFLETLRPGGPWVLTAIVPDGPTTTITATTPLQVRKFVGQHNSKQNLYYSLNPTRTALARKASKADIASIEFLHADLDPKPEETPGQAKERYNATLSAFSPGTSALIDSGNGVQALWRLHKAIVIPEDTAEAEKIIKDVEARIAKLTLSLGGTLGTQNIDRILRLPGTINLPNAKKKKEGRVEIPATQIWFNASTHLLEDFPVPEILPQEEHKVPEKPASEQSTQKLFDKLPASLKKLIAAPAYPGEDRSETAASVIYELKRRLSCTDSQIAGLFKAHPKGIGERYTGNDKKLADDIKRIEKKFINGVQTLVAPKTYIIVKASEVTLRAKDWLWEGHLLRGAQELLTGQPGLGKSQIQISIIACATASLPWPNGAPAGEPVNVIMLTAEDTIEQEVVPRLKAAGADTERVRILKWIKSDNKNRQFLLSEDLDQLERIVADTGNVGLLTVDPITAYMGARMDSHKATEVRAQLGPLKDFAEQTNIAICTITHPPKAASATKAIDHFIGSQAFIAAGRIGHLCVPDYDRDEETGERGDPIPGQFLLTNVKNNPHKKMVSLIYKIEQKVIGIDPARNIEIEAPFITWLGEKDVSADEAVQNDRGMAQVRKKDNRQARLQDLIMQIMGQTAPDIGVPQKEIVKAATANGFTENEIRTARLRCAILTEQAGGQWVWKLPLAGQLGKR